MARVQWFPGHMAKAKRLIQDNLQHVDVVIEVCDARAPRASANPLIPSIIQSKPRIIVLNKDDLADSKATELWMHSFTQKGQTLPVRVSGSMKMGLKVIPQKCQELCREASWFSRRPLRALIAGIPNVGKSTLINALSGRRKTQIGATPGLTRDLRRIPINQRFEIFDTPGLLWHKFDTDVEGIILAALGAVKETILPDEEVTGAVLSYFAYRYPRVLLERYKLLNIPSSPHELVESVGRIRGCIMAGGAVDYPRTCGMVLKDLREGKLGRVSLEWPDGKGWI